MSTTTHTATATATPLTQGELTPPQLEALHSITDLRERAVTGTSIRVHTVLARYGFCTVPAVGKFPGAYQHVCRGTAAGVAAADLVPGEISSRMSVTVCHYLVNLVARGGRVRTNHMRTPLAELRAYEKLVRMRCVYDIELTRGDRSVAVTTLGEAVAAHLG